MGAKVQTVAVDFDGVIHAYSRGWQDGTIYDEPMPGAVEGLRQLMATYAVFIHTSREPEQVLPWLADLGFDVTIDECCGRCFGAGGISEVDADGRARHTENPCSACEGSGLIAFWNNREQLLVTNRKLPAVAYLDDRAVRFTDWPTALVHLDVDPPFWAASETAELATRIRVQKQPCPDHPMPLPKPSCPRCARNGAFERAARIVLGQQAPGVDHG